MHSCGWSSGDSNAQNLILSCGDDMSGECLYPSRAQASGGRASARMRRAAFAKSPGVRCSSRARPARAAASTGAGCSSGPSWGRQPSASSAYSSTRWSWRSGSNSRRNVKRRVERVGVVGGADEDALEDLEPAHEFGRHGVPRPVPAVLARPEQDFGLVQEQQLGARVAVTKHPRHVAFGVAVPFRVDVGGGVEERIFCDF